MKRVLVHIGTWKTGTTTLQRSVLKAARTGQLSGVSYPDFGSANHGQLMLLFQDPADLPRTLRQRYLATDKAYEQHKKRIRRRLNMALRGSDRVILSTENFSDLSRREVEAFKAELDAAGVEEVLVSMYVREPAAIYKSFVQQVCKASHRVLQPHEFHYEFKAIIENWKSVFGDGVRVGAFAQDQLLNGCIVADFSQQICAFFGTASLSIEAVHQNESMTLEALAILRRYREIFLSESEDVFGAQTKAIEKALTQSDGLPFNTPLRLKADVADLVYRSHIDDLRWLAADYGIDYLRQTGGSGPHPKAHPKRYELKDLFEGYDDQRIECVLFHLLDRIVTSSRENGPRMRGPLKRILGRAKRIRNRWSA